MFYDLETKTCMMASSLFRSRAKTSLYYTVKLKFQENKFKSIMQNYKSNKWKYLKYSPKWRGAESVV